MVDDRAQGGAAGPSLARFERRGWELWLAPAVAAAVWGALIAQAGGHIGLARSLVFLGGPLVLLSGLFERLASYLHSPQRHRLLPLPLHPDLHFAAARGPHRAGLLASAVLGTGAVVLGAAADLVPAGVDTTAVALLVADWLWLVVLSTLTEPAIAAAASWLGRRFEDDTSARRLQLYAGGGWTLPEAVVHLYAPALGIGVAALLAMPGQLTLDRIGDGDGAPSGLIIASVLPLVVALGLRGWARRGYAVGMFEATAWLHQAIRSLAGPPIPEPAPRWVARLTDPMLKLWALQLWRVTPVPGLRLWTLLLVGGWIGVTGKLGLVQVAILAALVALWLVPAVRVARLRPGRQAFASAMPLPAPARTGACPRATWILAVPPVVALFAAVAGAFVFGDGFAATAPEAAP